jgi:hypothetical protein
LSREKYGSVVFSAFSAIPPSKAGVNASSEQIGLRVKVGSYFFFGAGFFVVVVLVDPHPFFVQQPMFGSSFPILC